MIAAAPSVRWDPGRGMGYLRVEGAPYDAEYFRKYERYAATPLGRSLDRLRVDLVARHAGPAAVLDVGVGSGAFIEARGGKTYGFDINPAAVAWLEDRGLFRDPHERPVEVMTFWDSIEHIPDPAPMLANARRWVFVSLPIVPGAGPPAPDWRHLRPDEHCWYWTRRGFVRWMAGHGFRCVEHNMAESEAGRSDIHSFAFRRADV